MQKLPNIRASATPKVLQTLACASEGFALKAAAEGDGKKIRSFSMTAYTGAAMNIMGFYRPVVVDLQGLSVPSQRVAILKDHDSAQIVGHTESVEVTAQRIKLEGSLSGIGGAAAEVAGTADNGFPWQASIGASVQKAEYVEAGQSVTVNGRKFTGPITVVRAASLHEVSFVALGADPATSAKVAAEAAGENTMNEFEKWLSAKFPGKEFTDAEKTVLKASFDVEHKPAAPVAQVVAAATVDPEAEAKLIEARRKADADRIEQSESIRLLCEATKIKTIKVGNEEVSLHAHAVRQGWTAKELELHILRAERAEPAQAPAGYAHSHDTTATLQAMQGAMILRAGGRLDNPVYQSQQAIALNVPQWLRAGINAEQKQRAMEAAHSLSAMSMVDMAREACRLDGRPIPRSRDEVLKAAFSGSALSNIFTTSVNAMLIDGYNEAGDTTEGWTRSEDVADFKTNDRIRLEKGPALSKLPRGKEADHSSRSDKVESYKIARYAKQFVVDDQDMIDDMFSALSDIPLEHGRAAARLRPDLVYSVLMSNPTLTATARELFNTTDGNLDTTSALAMPTLKLAISAMFLFQENGVNLNIRPTHLVVPPTLVFTARELLNSTMVNIARGGTTDLTVERGNFNALQLEQLQIVADSRLENGVTSPDTGTNHSGSASTWYLASNLVHTLVVGYLRGTGRAPQVRQWNLSEGKYGMGWDIAMDIGAKAMDWRGLHKATA